MGEGNFPVSDREFPVALDPTLSVDIFLKLVKTELFVQYRDAS